MIIKYQTAILKHKVAILFHHLEYRARFQIVSTTIIIFKMNAPIWLLKLMRNKQILIRALQDQFIHRKRLKGVTHLTNQEWCRPRPKALNLRQQREDPKISIVKNNPIANKIIKMESNTIQKKIPQMEH